MDWLFYENQAALNGYQAVCGIDEAGRGPLAGPVFAAAVILQPGVFIEGVDDSKKLTPKKRDILYDVIISQASAYFVASADVQEIEKYNILGATFLAMRRAALGLSQRPDYALIDGNRDPRLFCPAECIIGGDAKSLSVAAASILAKVSRDRYMLELDQKYPQYLFTKHKGYPTKEHYEAILKYGPSPVHRMHFLRNLEEKRLQFENG